MPEESQRVALLGASDKPDRYAYRAFRLLREFGHLVFPVHPVIEGIEGVPVSKDLSEVQGPIDTLTLYVRPQIAESLADDILEATPGRVIFNPGTESPQLQELLNRAGIPWEEACTLVLLQTGSF